MDRSDAWLISCLSLHSSVVLTFLPNPRRQLMCVYGGNDQEGINESVSLPVIHMHLCKFHCDVSTIFKSAHCGLPFNILNVQIRFQLVN